MAYYLIYNSDGDTIVKTITKDEAVRMAEEEDANFVGELPPFRDTNYWQDAKVIISGMIVVPYPIREITEWKMLDEF